MKLTMSSLPLFVWALTVQAAPVQAERPPNFVLILADDHSYRDFGFMGNSLVQTPHLDGLAAKSARYFNGYVPMSVCRPSLATLLTGLYPHQHGIHFNHPPPGLGAMRDMTAQQYRETRASAEYLIQAVPTLPRILAEHGYACLQTGKHWEGDFRTAGFTHGMTTALPSQEDKYGTRSQNNGQLVAHGNGDLGLAIGRDTMQPIFDFIDENADKQPFLVWYAPFLPHSPFDASAPFEEPYKKLGVPPHLLPYFAQVTRFDETVGQLVEFVENRGLSEQTVFVFLSDNGFRPNENSVHLNPRSSRSKWSAYEDGIRTPILIRWDGHVRAADHVSLVHAVDLVPTLLAAAGLSRQITPQMTGLNLLPSACGEQPLPDRAVFGAIYPNDAKSLGEPSRHVLMRWIRRGDFKLIAPAAKNTPRLLFDLGRDPREELNLAGRSEFELREKHLQNMLDQWWAPGDDSDVAKPES